MADSATKYCQTLKRIIYISSAAVHLLGQPGVAQHSSPRSQKSDTGSLPHATALQSRDPIACSTAAKVEAENYLRSASKTWEFVILHPVGVCGPIIHPMKGFGKGSHSLDWGYGFLSGKWKSVPPVAMYNTVDVRDLAKLCVVSLDNDGAARKAINVVGPGVLSLQLVADTIRDLWPEMDIPIGLSGKLVPDGEEGFEVGRELFAEAFR